MQSAINKPQKVEISYRTIIFITLFGFGIWFLWAIGSTILQFFVAIIIMTAFNPLVNRIERIKLGKHNIRRPIGIIFVYLIFFIGLGSFITIITQPLVMQTSSLIKQFPLLLERLGGWGIDQAVIEKQLSQLDTLPADMLKFISGAFSNLFSVFTTLVMAFYLLLEREKLHKNLTYLIGNSDLEDRVEKFFDHLEHQLGGWIRAELLLMLAVGGLTYLGLLLLGVPFALPLAIIAGLLEIIPNIGPVISAIPAIIVALTLSPLVGVGVVTLYLFIQLLENNFIVPQIMSKAVGINPLVTIVVLLMGLNLAGIMGAVLSVPTVLLVRSVIKHFFSEKWMKRS